MELSPPGRKMELLRRVAGPRFLSGKGEEMEP